VFSKGKIMALRLQQKPTNGNSASRDATLDDFVAELTEAAYPLALRHEAGRDWLGLELELWRVMTQTVKKWEQRAFLPGLK
jgi:hypothetical protein